MVKVSDPVFHFGTRLKSDGSGCWIMQGSPATNGYFQYRVKGDYFLAHRWSMTCVAGISIPPDLEVDHLCNVRACQRPGHMELVTRKENIRRKWERHKFAMPDHMTLSGPSRTISIDELFFGIKHHLPTLLTPTLAEKEASQINFSKGLLL